MTTRRKERSTTRRSLKRNGKSLFSVESLQSSFERLNTRAKEMIEQGKTDSDIAVGLHRMWTNMFHTDLSTAELHGMISHYRGMSSPSTRRRRTRKAGRRVHKQKGGMAPLDYTMGQGTTEQVYGRFPIEISAPQPLATLDMTRFFESPVGRDCNATGGFPAPTQTQTQAGGGFFDALITPHAPASVPRNMAEMSLSAIQGAPITNPAPSPVTAQVPLMQSTMPVYDAKAIQPISSLAPVGSY